MRIVADENIPFVKQCFSSAGDVRTYPGRKITPAVLGNADVLLVRSITKVGRGLLDKSGVKFVGTATIGFEHIDIEYLRQKGIGFASAPGCNSNSVAEYVTAALLEISHRSGTRLEGKSIGIIGVGNCGGKVAAKSAALGMETIMNDPPLARQTQLQKYRPLEELFNCDFITLHTPLACEGRDKTFHLADKKFFGLLKPGCVFINCSRGPVTESEALESAIKSGKVKSSVLDVWENEPHIDSELLRICDITTPHIAGYSLDGKVAGMIMIYRAVCRFFDIEAVHNSNLFLPSPQVSRISLDPRQAGTEQGIRRCVKEIYDIENDSAGLRKILTMPENKAGPFFDSLRKNYPIRREFHNTTISLQQGDDGLSRKLKGIGFKVENERF